MHKRKTLFLVLVLQIILTSCLSKTEPDNIPSGETVVSSTVVPTRARPSPSLIIFACPGTLVSHYQELGKRFHQTNSDIRVQVIPQEEIIDTTEGWPEDAAYQIMTRADTALLQTATWEDFQQGVLQDLQPLIEADPNFRSDDFYPAALEAFRWRGSTWALPKSIDPTLIFYDKDAFDAAGVPYPQPRWTWEDFVDKARALTVRREGEVARYGFADQWAVSSLGIVSGMTGETLVDRSGQSPEPMLNSPEVTEAAERYVDMALVEEAMFTGYESGEPRQVFALIDERRTAMWTEEASRGRQRGEDFRVGMVPFPKGEVGNNLTWAQGLVMSAGTDHPQESWRWLKFLSSQQPVAGEMIPSRRSVAEGMSYWEDLDDELRTACQYALEHPLTWWTYEETTSAFYHAVREALGGESVGETLTQAQQHAYEEIATLLKNPPLSITVVPIEPEKPPGGTTITFASFLSPHRKSYLYRTLVEDFNEDHPDIAVKLVFPQGTYSFEDRADSADCFQWYGPLTYSPSGVLTLEPFVEADPEFNLHEFYVQGLEAFRWKGELWGLPATISPQVIFYNKELFDEAGVEYPEPGWTWDDFLSKVSRLTSEDEKRYGFLDMPLDSKYMAPNSILFPVIVSHTGPLSEFPLPFDDSRIVNAVKWYFNMEREFDVLPVNEEERRSLIMEGKAAMWIDLARQAGYYRSKLREHYEIGTVPLPVGETRAASFIYDGYFISKKTEHPRECWDWIKYLSIHLLPEEYGGWGLPAFQPLAESSQFREKMGDEEARAYHESLGYEAISLSALFGGYPTFYHRWEALVEALEGIVRGADIEAALRKAEMSVERRE